MDHKITLHSSMQARPAAKLYLRLLCLVLTECQKGTCNGKDESPRQLEICRIKGLPDLNQTVPYVAETLHKWMAWIRDEFQIDGFRVDAAKHMPAVSC